eukprot:scaffold1307_cov200-Pinguiococcus_pyrenoidosus.AAC.88
MTSAAMLLSLSTRAAHSVAQGASYSVFPRTPYELFKWRVNSSGLQRKAAHGQAPQPRSAERSQHLREACLHRSRRPEPRAHSRQLGDLQQHLFFPGHVL